MSDATTPEELRAPKGARVMEIVWADGETSRYHHRVLRGFCPCAHCQGHEGPVRWIAAVEGLPESALDITEIEEIGQYAVRFAFADGHGTGIYTFRFLRALGDAGSTEVGPVRDLTFSR